MKQLGILVITVALLPYPLLAQQASTASAEVPSRPTRIQVEKFMEVMQVRQRLESTVRSQQEDLSTVTHNMFRKAFPDATPEQKAQVENIIATSLREMFTDYPFDEVLRDMIPIYQSHFSESDLKEIAAFYSSPIGKKVLREMPEISAQTTRVALARLQPKIDEMMKNLDIRLKAMVNESEPPSAQQPQ